MVETSNNNTKQPCGFTRARAHAPITRTCATLAHQTKSLILNAAVALALLFALGAGNTLWGQPTPLDPGENFITTSNNQGTYIVPEGYYISKIELIGGGGGGQGSNSSDQGGRGGGGGGYSAETLNVTDLPAGTTITVTVGAGGSAGYRGKGGNGGFSSVTTGSGSSMHTWAIAYGGTGGSGTSIGTAGGAGGIGSTHNGGAGGGIKNYTYDNRTYACYAGGGGGGAANTGDNGEDGAFGTMNGSTFYGGDGGNAGDGDLESGSGGTGGYNNNPATGGQPFGGGGGGSYRKNTSGGASGGAGAAGCVRITCTKEPSEGPHIITTNSYEAPRGYYINKIQCWGAGGGGKAGYIGNSANWGGAGGGGGGYAEATPTNIPSGDYGKVYIKVGEGGAGGQGISNWRYRNGSPGDTTYVTYTMGATTDSVIAYGGGGATFITSTSSSSNIPGTGGSGHVTSNWQSSSYMTNSGGNGGNSSNAYGGGGGGGAGSANNANGSDGSAGSTANNSAGASGGNGGSGNIGGKGGRGGYGNNNTNRHGQNGSYYGGGGGGGYQRTENNNNRTYYSGGRGGDGCVIISTAPIEISVKLNAGTDAVTWNSVFGTASGSSYTYVCHYDQQVFTDAAMAGTDAIARTGYVFDGWFTAAQGGTRVTSTSMLDESVITNADLNNGAHSITKNLYAHWRAISCVIVTEPCTLNCSGCGNTITWDAQLGHYTFPVTQNSPISSCLATCDLNAFTRDGYDYQGCFTQDGQTQINFSGNFTGNEDTVVYAKWTAKEISFVLDANGDGAHFGDGAADSTVRVTFDNTYSTITGWESFGVKRPGHTFAGWYTASTGGTQVNGNDTYDDITVTRLYAHWTKNSYTITFNANGGKFGNSSNSPTTRTSDSFLYGSNYSTVRATSGSTTYTWGYNSNDYVSMGLYNYSVTGYEFDGWWTLATGGEEVKGSDQYLLESNQTLYAHWKPRTYTCTLYLDGGTAPTCDGESSPKTSFQVRYGQNLNEAFGCNLNGVTKNASTFDGWYLTRTENTVPVIGYVIISYEDPINPETYNWSTAGNGTIYAKWNLQDITVQVTLDAQSGTVDNQSSINYSLSYWYKDIDLPYKENILVNQYGKMEDVAAGYLWENQNYLTNRTMSRTGYHGGNDSATANNWYTEPNGGGRLVEDTSLLRRDYNDTLYYWWMPNRYVCTIDPDGGTLIGSCATYNHNGTYSFTLTYDSPVGQGLGTCDLTSKQGISKTGYSVEGLYWNSAKTNPVDLTQDWKQTNSATIYVKWKPDTFGVVLDAGSGTFRSGTTDTTIRAVYNEKYGSILNSNDDRSPLREGYTLRGWKDAVTEALVTAGDKHLVDKDRTLNAQWEKNITVATITQDSVKCKDGHDGGITVSGIEGGQGSTYTVTIAKVGDNTVQPWSKTGTSGQTEFVFEGDAQHPITMGVWSVTVHDGVHWVDFPDTAGADSCRFFTDTVHVLQPAQLEYVTVNPMNPDCYHLNGRVGIKIKGGTQPYKVFWQPENENVPHQLDVVGDTATFEHYVSDTLKYTLTLTDKYGCVTDPLTRQVTLYPRTDPFDYTHTPITKTNVCNGSSFSVNPGDSAVSNDPTHTYYSWGVPVSLDNYEFTSGGEGRSEASVHDTITHTYTHPITVTYTVIPKIGDYCIGEPFTVNVEVNAGGSPVRITQTKQVDTLCVDGGNVVVNVENAVAGNTLTWVLDGDTGKETVKTESVEAGTHEVTYTVNATSACSADSTYNIYYIDNSGCSSELTKRVHLEIGDWSVSTTDTLKVEVDCISDVVNPLNNETYKDQVPDHTTMNVCGRNVVRTLQPEPQNMRCNGEYSYTFRYTVENCDSYRDWTFTYNVTGENTEPTITKHPNAYVVASVATGSCGYRVPDFTDSVDVSDDCTENPEISQVPAAGTLINETTEVVVTATDACGKYDTVHIRVTVPQPLSLPENIAHTDLACYGQDTARIIVNGSASGGTTPYSYRLDSRDYQPSSTFTDVDGGNHMVVVQDANNCRTSRLVTIYEPAALSITREEVNNVSCKYGSDGSFTVKGQGGTAPYQFKLSDSTLYNNANTNGTYTFAGLKQKSYTVDVKDGNGCETSVGVTVNEPAAELKLRVVPDVNICPDADATLFAAANGGNGGYSYKWFIEETNIISQDQFTTVSPEDTTTYFVAVMDSKGCKDTTNVTVNVRPDAELTLDANATQTVCFGNAITPVKITTNVPLSPTSYLSVYGQPDDVSIASTNGENPQLQGTPTAAGNYAYMMTAISPYGCKSAYAEGTIAVINPSVALYDITGDTTICYGDGTTLSVALSDLNGTPTFQWKKDGTPITEAITNTLELQNMTEDDTGTYSVEVFASVTNNGVTCNSETVVKKVKVRVLNPQVTVPEIAAQTVCHGDAATFTADVTASKGTVNYQWKDANGNAVGTNSPSFTTPATLEAGEHVYTVTITATVEPCTSAPEVRNCALTVRPQFDAGEIRTEERQVCYNAEGEIRINSTRNAAGGGNKIGYQWYHNGQYLPNANDSVLVIQLSDYVGVPGEHTFVRAACDTTCNAGLTMSNGQWILVVLQPKLEDLVIIPSDTTICHGESINLTADASSKYALSYAWTKNEDPAVIGTHATLQIPSLTDTTTYYVTVTATYPNSNCTASDEAEVTVNVRPAFDPGNVNPENKSQEVCFGAEDSEVNAIAATPATGGEAPIEYRWIHNYNNVNDTIFDTTYNLVLAGYSEYPGTHTFTREAKDQVCEAWTESPGSYVLTVDPKFNAGAISTIGQTICVGGDVNLIGSTTDASGGRGDITYSWYHRLNQGEEELITGADSAKFDPSAYNQIPGEHYFTRKAANATCNSTAQSTGIYVLNVNPALELNIEGPTAICAGNSLDNNVLTLRETNGSTDSYTYLWTTGNNEGASISSGQNGTEVKVSWPNAGTGHITLTVRNNNTNCISESTVTVTVYATPLPSISGSTSVCMNSNDFPTGGRFTATPAALSSYVWSADAGSTSVAIHGESANVDSVSWVSVGPHYVNVKVTDGNGCSAQVSKEVTVNSLPILSVSTTSVSCHGGNNGTITATATNGSATYTYTYTLNDTSSNTTGLFEGLTASTAPHHTVVVTDPNGCKAKKTGIVIGQSADFTVVIDSIHFTSCAGNDGWIRARVLGSGMFDMGVYDQDDSLVGSYPAHHNAGEPFEKTGLSYGVNYTLKVNAYGDQNCVDTKPFYMDKNDTLEIKSIPQPPTLCSGESNSFDVLPVVNITDGTRYSWAAPDVNPVNGIQDVSNHHNENQTSVHDAGLINTTTGNVELTYHVVATNGVCQTTGDLVMEVGVTVQPPITINAGELLPIRCPDDRDLILQAEFGGVVNDQTTVTWTFPTIDDRTHTNVVNTTENKDTLMVTLPNVYNTTYHYTVQFTDGVCTNSDGGDVVVPDKLVMEVDTISNVTCYGGNNGFVTIRANGGSGTANSNYYYSIAGSDFVERVSGTPYTRMNLSIPEPSRDSTDLLGDTKCGDYSVQIKDERGCTLDTIITICSPVEIKWVNVPKDTVVCCDQDTTYATVNFESPSLNTYANIDLENISDYTDISNENANRQYNIGTNVVSYFVMNDCYESDEQSFTITVRPNPDVDFGDNSLASQDVCFGNSIQDIQLTFANATLKDTLLPPGVTLNKTTGLISGTPTEQLTSPKTYNYLIIATSNQSVEGFEGCGSDTLKGSITVYPTPTVQLTYTPDSCAGSRGRITARITSGTTMPLVRLSFDGGTHDPWLTDYDKIYDHLEAGTHTLTVWSWEGTTEGCSVTETLDLPLYSPYLAPTNHKFSDTTYTHLCSGDSFDILPKAPTFQNYATTYKWEAPTGSVTGGAAATTAQDTVNGGPLSNTTNTVQNAVYKVTPTTGTVCVGPAFTVTVPVNPTVVMNTPANQTICSDSTIAAVTFGTNITDGSMSYSWERDNTTGITGLGESGTGNIADTALKNPTTEVQTTTFTVTPTYTNGVSCVGGTPVSFTITVNPEVILTAYDNDNLEQTITYGEAITPVVFSYSSHAALTHTELPAGLSFNTTTNTLSGTPAAAGDHTVTFTATSTQEPNCGKKELTVTIHVNKAAVNVKAVAKAKVYGETDPTLTATVTGLQNGDADSVITYTLSRAAGENVGEYVITPTGDAEQGNYTVTYDTAKFTITRAVVLVNADAKTKTYGANDPTLTATVTGLQYGEEASVITYTLSRTAGENVGEYVITPIGAAVQGNYTVTYDTAKFTITRANAIVKADNKTKPFGTADPTLTAMVTGLVNGDAENAIIYTLSRTSGENAGTYTITPTGAAEQGNYNVTYQTGTLTITPISITVTVTGNTAVKTYTGSQQSVTGYTVVATDANYDVSHVVYTGDSIAQGTGSATGDATYPMTLDLTKFSNNDPNYQVTFAKVDGWLRIVPEGTVIVNITGHTATTNYDAQPHSVIGYDVEIVAPEDKPYTEDDFTFNGQASLNKTNAGVYPMGLAATQFANINANVDNVIFNVTDGSLTINKVNAVVTVTGNHDTRAYDGSEHTIANYVVSDADPAFYTESDFTFSGTATATRADAGTTYMGLADNQFTNTNANFEHVTFHVTDGYQTIQPIEVAVTVTGHTYMHEYTTHEQSVTGYDVVASSALFSEDDIVFGGDSTAAGTLAGIYPMGLLASQFSCGNPNFQATFSVTDGWLEIVPAGVVIVTITGHTATKDYNCAEQSVSGYEVEIGGVTDDPEPVSYANIYKKSYFSLVNTAPAVASGTDAGTYYMGLDATKFVNNNAQFYVQFHVTDGSLTINKVNAEVTITGKSEEVTYNGQPHTVTGYTISNVTPACYNTDYVHFTGSVADSTSTRTDAGTTDMNLVEGLFQNTNPNFETVTFHVVNGKLTVNKAAMAITVNGDSTSRVYTGTTQTYIGAAVATSTSTGFDASKFGYSGGTTVSGTSVGNYTMALVSDNCSYDDDNYTVSWTIGKPVRLTITKAAMNITVNGSNGTLVYTGSEQSYVGTVTPTSSTTGFDANKFSYSGNKTATGTAVGDYTTALVKASCAYNDNNYTVNWTIGEPVKLTITKAAITLTCPSGNALTQVYNGSELHPAATAAGVVAGDVIKVEYSVNDGASWSETVAGITNVGTQAVKVRASNANYDTAYCEYTLTVTQATLTITVNGSSTSEVYDGTVHSYTGTVTATSTSAGFDATKFSYSGEKTASGTNAGDYTTALVTNSCNYNDNNYYVVWTIGTPVKLTITKAPLTVTTEDKSKVYGAADPTLTATVTGMVNNDTEAAVRELLALNITRATGEAVGEYLISATGNTLSNYDVTYNNTGKLTITKADLTITINNTNKVYDNSPLVTNYNDNGVSISGNAANAHLSAGKVTTTGTAVGIYTYANQTVTITEPFAMSDGITNYNVTYDITMEITQSQVVINCPTAQSDTEKVYNGTPISYTVSASTGTGENVTVEYSTDNQSWSTTKPSRTDVGETQVYVRAYAANYATQYCQYKLKVTPLAVTVTVTGNHDTKTYDAAEHTAEGYTATTDDELYKVSGDTPDFGLASGQTAVAKRTNEGTTNMGLTTNSFVNNNPNFNVTFLVAADGYMTINKRALTITAKDQTFTYNGAAQGENNATYTNAAKVTVEGLQGADALTSIKLNGMETNAGVYTNKIEPSAAAIGNATGNYDITYVKGKLTINTVALTITAKNQEYTYNGNVQGPAGIYASGFDTYVTVSGLQGSDALSSITMAGGKTNVGEYANEIVPSAAAIGNSTGNYNISYNNATLTINKANLTITVKTSNYYDGTVLEANFDDDSVSLSGNMNNASLSAGKVKTNAATVGTYSYADNTVTINPAFAMSDGISNYNVTYNITMEIKKNVVNMTCTDADRVYDATPFSHSIEATVVHGTPTVEYSLDSLNWSTTAPSRTDAGTTKVYVRAFADNYDTAACSYDLTVNKRYVKITTPGGIFLYDGQTHHSTGTYNIEGDNFVAGQAYGFNMPAEVTELGTCVTDTITYETSAAFNANNYTIEYQLGQLCISGNAPIVITSASNTNPIYYDGQLHGTESAYRTYTVTYDSTEMPVIEGSNGLKFRLPAGDTVTITPTFTGVTFFDDANNTPNNNVFTYTITHDDFYVGPRTLNYGTVNITKRPITFTIAPALASKTYDGDIMTVNATDLTVGGQGLATTDALTAGIVKTDNFVAGEYTCAEGGFQAGYQGVAIKEGFVIKHSNGHITTSSYNPQFNVKLTINQKAITVTAENAEKVYDGTELTNNNSYAITSGELVTGDNLYATVTGGQTCVGEGKSTISTTTVLRGTTDVTGSYNITTVSGTLTVKPITEGFACPQDTTVIMKDDDDNVVVTADIIGQASLVPTTPSVLDHITITNNLDERNPMSEGVDTVTWTLRDECGKAMTTCEQLVTIQYKPCDTITYWEHEYPAVRIGHQCWLTEDLRYEFGNYTAYNNLTENAEKFGYLYSWYTAMGVPEGTTTVDPTIDTADNGSLYVQGICPEGWAVGSMADFHTLELTAGSISSLKDPSTLYWQSGYEGDNPGTGFNARGGGWYNSTRSRYEDIKTGYHFWKADAPGITTLTNSSTVVSLLISYHCDQILEQTSQKSDRRSVRCIRKKINP